jgi:hypothetical protein
MKQRSKIVLFLFAITAYLLSGCVEKEQYPLIPVIKYAGFMVDTTAQGYDSIGIVTITYTDGDGDLGLDSTDTAEPYLYNYYFTFMQMKEGVLQPVELPDSTINFNARIPILTPSGKNKNISGEISRTLELYQAWSALSSDTIGFEIYVKDRALNVSNIVQSPLYILKRPAGSK